MRHKNISYPKIFYPNDFQTTVTRFELFQINFKNLPDTYCICVRCEALPAKDPCPCRIILITFTQFEVIRINWVMFSWQIVFEHFRNSFRWLGVPSDG